MGGGLPIGSALWTWGLAVVCALLLASCGGQSATPSPTVAPDDPLSVAVVTSDSSPTAVPLPTAEPSPTSTATPAPSTTPVPTETPATPAPSVTPLSTHTPTPLPTDTPTPLPTETPAPLPTETPTPATAAPSATPVPTETPTPVPTETPTPAPTATPTPTARDIAAGHLSELLPWFDDPPDDNYSAAAEQFVTIWLVDVELAEAVVGLDWVANKIGSGEVRFLRWLIGLADTDLELSQQVLGYPWLADDVTGDEMAALRALGEVASNNLDLARHMASLHWFADGLNASERRLLREIEPETRDALELVGLYATFLWYGDGLTTEEERGLFHTLRLIAARDADLARLLAGYQWIADEVLYEEWGIVHALNELASTDLELARTVAGLPWFADDVVEEEWWTLSRLHGIAAEDIELARALTALSGSRNDAYLLLTLARIADRGADKLAQLTAQPWFTDGIDDEEAALLIAMEDAAGDARNLFVSLARNHHTQSKSVSLPLSGEVDFWAFQAIPFPRNKDVVGMMEEAVSAGESLFGTPFPMKDVILVLQPVGGATRNYGGQFRWDHMRLVMYDFSDVNRRTIYHEIGHYYLRGGVGPTWLVEGGAEFVVSYVMDSIGVDSLEVRLPTTRRLVRNNCHNQGVRSITKLNERYPEEYDSLVWCPYNLGEYFLHNLFDLMGEDAMSAALRDLLLLHKSTGAQLTEEEIYQTFKMNVPRGREDRFNEAYRLWHGGDFIDP